MRLGSADGAGIPTVGFYAQVPHYVGGPFASATIGLLEHAGRHLGVELPLERVPMVQKRAVQLCRET